MFGIGFKLPGAVALYIPDLHTFLPVVHRQNERIAFYDVAVENASHPDLLQTYEKILKKHLERVPPIAFVLLTNRCNMSCSFCYARKNSDSVNCLLDIKDLKRLREVLPAESFSQVSFSGGEPLLEFGKMKEMRHLFGEATIYTNGSLIDREILKWALDYGKTRFYVNLDYKIDDIQGHDSGKVRENLERLSRDLPAFRRILKISVVMKPDNLRELKELRMQRRAFEKDVLHEFNFIPGSRLTALEDVTNELDRIERGEITSNDSFFLRYLRYVHFTHEHYMNTLSCDPSISVSYRGDVLLCHEYGSFNEQNVCSKFKVSSVGDFTLSKYYDHVNQVRGSVPDCVRNTGCLARLWCGGICWANIKNNPYLCEMTRMGLLGAIYMTLQKNETDLLRKFPGDVNVIGLREIDYDTLEKPTASSEASSERCPTHG